MSVRSMTLQKMITLIKHKIPTISSPVKRYLVAIRWPHKHFHEQCALVNLQSDVHLYAAPFNLPNFGKFNWLVFHFIVLGAQFRAGVRRIPGGFADVGESTATVLPRESAGFV